MQFTCKKCCSIFKDQVTCPICGKVDDIKPIRINVQNNSRK